MKEFKAIEKKKSLDPNTDNQEEIQVLEANGEPKPRKDYGNKEENEAHMYDMDPIDDTTFQLCPHGRISIDSILKGELKAVQRIAAEGLLEYYGLGLAVMSPDWEFVGREAGTLDEPNGNRLRTGLDLCVECVKRMRTEASFKVSA